MKSGNLEIRKAALADAEGLAACIDAAYARYSGRISDMPSVSDGIEDEITNNQVWVVVEDGDIIAVSAKVGDVVVHPLQCSNHVQVGVVAAGIQCVAALCP
mgnify:CR=1 FL=1